MELIDSLIKDGWLKTPRIIRAFREVKRIDFMSEGMEKMAEINEALPIECDQTISQPLTVAFMIEQLQPEAGDNILDIGSGSGWTAALLSYIVGKKGKVTAIEIIPKLKKWGEKNVSKYNFINNGIAQFICANGYEGYKEGAPFDKILVSASAKEVPNAWKEQLKIKGKIVASIKNSIWTLVKIEKNKFEKTEHKGFIFVPLIKK